MADKFTPGRIDTHEYVAKMKKADGTIAEAVEDLEEVVGDSESGLVKDVTDLNTAITNVKGFAGDIIIEQRTQGNHYWVVKANYPTSNGLYRLVKNGVPVGFMNVVMYYTYYIYGYYILENTQYLISSSAYAWSTTSTEFQLDQSQFVSGEKKYYLHNISFKATGSVAMTDGTTETMRDSYPYTYVRISILAPYGGQFTLGGSGNDLYLTPPSSVTSEAAMKVLGSFINMNGDYNIISFSYAVSPTRITLSRKVLSTTGLIGTVSYTATDSFSDSVVTF